MPRIICGTLNKYYDEYHDNHYNEYYDGHHDNYYDEYYDRHHDNYYDEYYDKKREQPRNKLFSYNTISGSKDQKVVRACTIRLLNLGPTKLQKVKHEKIAIYAVNQRISNV